MNENLNLNKNEKPQILDQFGNPITSSQLEQTEKSIEQMPEPVEQKSEQVRDPEKLQEQIAIEHEKLDKNQQDIKDQVEKMGGMDAVNSKINKFTEGNKNFDGKGMLFSGALGIGLIVLAASGLPSLDAIQNFSTLPAFAQNIVTGGAVMGGGLGLVGGALSLNSVGRSLKNFFENRKLKKLENLKSQATEAGIE